MRSLPIRFALISSALLVLTTPAVNADVYGVVGRRGAVVAGDDRVVVARRAPSAVVVTPPARTVVVAPLPRGYIRVVPAGYTRVVYRGYHCYFVGGVYYRSVIYQGETVYVVVN